MNDILIAGTTWLQEIIYLIYNDADTEAAKSAYLYERFPYIESTLPMTPNAGPALQLDYMLDQKPPRLMKSHLPKSFFRRTLATNKTKVVVPVRNPKDVLVSLYHFYQMVPVLGSFPGTWDQFFQHLYMKKQLFYGDYFDFYEGWWRYKAENPDQVLFVWYEDLKRDVTGVIRALASFLGKSMTERQIEIIKEHTTFDHMKANEMIRPAPTPQREIFFRKGQVGDWKNYFSQDQSDYVEKEANERLKPLGLNTLD